MEQFFKAIVIGVNKHSDRFDLIHLFSNELGGLNALRRKSTKIIGSQHLDLFQTLEITTQKKNANDIGFIKEFQATKSRNEIASHYDSFDFASQFCRAVRLNAQHMSSPSDVFLLLEQSLNAWNEKPGPHIIYLKALYRLAYEDGFPVKEDWLLKLSKSDIDYLKSVLFLTVEEQKTTASELSPYIENLKHWLKHQQEFIF